MKDGESYTEINYVESVITSKDLVKLLNGEEANFEIWHDGEYLKPVMSKLKSVFHPHTNEQQTAALIYRPPYPFQCPQCMKEKKHIIVITHSQSLLVFCTHELCGKLTWIDTSLKMTPDEILKSFKADFSPEH